MQVVVRRDEKKGRAYRSGGGAEADGRREEGVRILVLFEYRRLANLLAKVKREQTTLQAWIERLCDRRKVSERFEECATDPQGVGASKAAVAQAAEQVEKAELQPRMTAGVPAPAVTVPLWESEVSRALARGARSLTRLHHMLRNKLRRDWHSQPGR